MSNHAKNIITIQIRINSTRGSEMDLFAMGKKFDWVGMFHRDETLSSR